MITGLPGHKRGKRYVKGIGYVTPERANPPPNVCKNRKAVEPRARGILCRRPAGLRRLPAGVI